MVDLLKKNVDYISENSSEILENLSGVIYLRKRELEVKKPKKDILVIF